MFHVHSIGSRMENMYVLYALTLMLRFLALSYLSGYPLSWK